VKKPQKYDQLADLLAFNYRLPAAMVHHCTSCGSDSDIAQGVLKRCCPFCGNSTERNDQPNKRFEPTQILPFRLVRNQAKKAITDWNDSRNSFQEYHDRILSFENEILNQAVIEPVYLPFWFFVPTQEDLESYKKLQAELISNSGPFPVNEHAKSLTNLPSRIPSYNGAAMPNHELNILEPWPLEEALPFDPVFVRSVAVESPHLELESAAQKFRRSVAFSEHYMESYGCDADLQGLTRNDGKSQLLRDLSGVEIPQVWGSVLGFERIQVCQILLPVWICNFSKNQKKYRIFVNGATGEIVWDIKPYGGIVDPRFRIIRKRASYGCGCLMPVIGFMLANAFMITYSSKIGFGVIIVGSVFAVILLFVNARHVSRILTISGGSSSVLGTSREISGKKQESIHGKKVRIGFGYGLVCAMILPGVFKYLFGMGPNSFLPGLILGLLFGYFGYVIISRVFAELIRYIRKQ
jgi:predicted RNA-binding Zn-ribbon protein involved in translation (DUF1610 family)